MALSCTQRPKNERKLAIVFHQNGLSTVPARLIAPGSRLVGFGPHTPAPSRCGDQWRARASADALSLAQNSTFRRARSSVHDTPPAHPRARFPPRPARDARTPRGRAIAQSRSTTALCGLVCQPVGRPGISEERRAPWMIGLPGRMSGDLLQVVSYAFGQPGRL